MKTNRSHRITRKLLFIVLAGTLPLGWENNATADALDHWTRVPLATVLGADGIGVSRVACGNGRYVAVGQYVLNDLGFFATSDDGVVWRPRAVDDSFILDLYSVAYGNGVFVAVGWDWFGGGNLWSSLDGIHWTRHANPTVSNFYEVTYGGSVFVAVGDGMLPGTSTTTNRNIYTSSDGIAWTQRSCGLPSASAREIRGVAYGSGRFAAVDGAGRVLNSLYGGSWTFDPVATAYAPISFCGDRFIARAQSGENLVSPDGVNWSGMVKNVTNNFGRVAYGHGLFLALSRDKIFSSTDATNWVQRPISVSEGTAFSDVAFGERNAVAIANENPQRPVMPVAFVSDPFVALEITRAFPPQLALFGLEGLSYRIEYADILQTGAIDWRPLVTLSLTNSPQTWTDTTATGSQRFYRAVLLP